MAALYIVWQNNSILKHCLWLNNDWLIFDVLAFIWYILVLIDHLRDEENKPYIISDHTHKYFKFIDRLNCQKSKLSSQEVTENMFSTGKGNSKYWWFWFAEFFACSCWRLWWRVGQRSTTSKQLFHERALDMKWLIADESRRAEMVLIQPISNKVV